MKVKKTNLIPYLVSHFREGITYNEIKHLAKVKFNIILVDGDIGDSVKKKKIVFIDQKRACAISGRWNKVYAINNSNN